MGCNCGGGGTIAQNGQRNRRVSAAAARPSAESNPVLIGETSDGEVWRVRVMVPVEGLTIGAAVYVTGRGVAEHLASGAFLDITMTNQRRRMWRVGQVTFTSEQRARRVAAATGKTAIEVA